MIRSRFHMVWFSVICIVLLHGKIVSAEELYATSGIWPDHPMRSGLHTTALDLDETNWQESFLTRDLIFRLYGVVGATKPDAKSFVTYENESLSLGGSEPHESASVIWRFAAPPGNAFAGGNVTIHAEIREKHGTLPEDALRVATGTTLQLLGGGEYLKPFNSYDGHGLAMAPFDPSIAGSIQKIQLKIPAGSDEFFVAVTRDQIPAGSARLVIYGIAVSPVFRDPAGMTIRFDRVDPLWSADESIELKVNVSGKPVGSTVKWCLTRDDQPSVSHSGFAATAETTSAFIDISHVGAGFWTLVVADSIDTGKILDRQQLVVLRAQDPHITHEQSIFGAFEAMGNVDVARRMGVKWDVTVKHWSSAQPAEDVKIQVDSGDAPTMARDQGFEPIVLIGNSPAWANGGQEEIVPPLAQYYEHWYTFNKEVARAYAGKVTWYQTWNEPNNPFAFKYEKTEEERRIKAKQVQRVQHDGLKAGDPNAKLIGGCFANVPAGEFAAWLSDPFNVLHFQDAMSGHNYSPSFPEEHYRHTHPPEPALVPDILAARRIMDNRGAANQPLFWTEYGWQPEHLDDEARHARWQARHMIIMQAYREKTRTCFKTS